MTFFMIKNSITYYYMKNVNEHIDGIMTDVNQNIAAEPVASGIV